MRGDYCFNLQMHLEHVLNIVDRTNPDNTLYIMELESFLRLLKSSNVNDSILDFEGPPVVYLEDFLSSGKNVLTSDDVSDDVLSIANKIVTSLQDGDRVCLSVGSRLRSANPSFLEVLLKPSVEILDRAKLERLVWVVSAGSYDVRRDLNETLDRLYRLVNASVEVDKPWKNGRTMEYFKKLPEVKALLEREMKNYRITFVQDKGIPGEGHHLIKYRARFLWFPYWTEWRTERWDYAKNVTDNYNRAVESIEEQILLENNYNLIY
jgi:hypothetical protein